MSSHSDDSCSKFIRVVRKYLLENHNYVLDGMCMQDKDEPEFSAFKLNNLRSLLCEFHAVKIFVEKSLNTSIEERLLDETAP